MSKNQNSRVALCGNCKHFVAGGLCELVKGQINSKSTCDLHEFGDPKPIDVTVNPTHTKTKTNYKPGFISETVTGDLVQKAIQMEHELLARGIPEEEVHRAVVAYFSQPEPPPAMPWPGPVTGLDLAGNINPLIVPDTGEPLTDFTGLPNDVQPYPTPNVSPYGIGTTSQPYPSFYSPSPNLGSLSNTYDVLNYPYPGDNTNWNATASDLNSQPSMHGEYGYNVASTVPPFPKNYEGLHNDYHIHSKGIEPSGALHETFNPKELSAGIEIELEHTNNRDTAKKIAIDHLREDPKYYTKLLTHVEPEKKHLLERKITEAKKDDTKKKLLTLLGKWTILLGGVVAIDSIIKNYLDSGDEKPLKIIAQYNYHGHDKDDECAKFSGKRFDLLETHNRPVIPSEKLGYTTTHPQCVCTWDVKPNVKPFVNKLSKNQQDEISKVEKHITQAAKKGELHKVNKDGKLSKKTTSKNPLKELCSCMNVTLPPFNLSLPKRAESGSNQRLHRKALQEAITNLRSEFVWLTDDYISNAKKLANDAGGELYLVRAAGEAITDHTGEGEPYRRKLSSEELNAMARTAIGKSMDINHQPEFETDATILDAEFDKNRKEMQMLVVERDPQIIDAINDGKITAVSINGGMPRSENIEPCNGNCDGNNCELCLVPQGVVLGELDGIAMTWVITDKNGLYWNGHHVSSAEPGIKFTKIESL